MNAKIYIILEKISRCCKIATAAKLLKKVNEEECISMCECVGWLVGCWDEKQFIYVSMDGVE
jgi:hypothetical protein